MAVLTANVVKIKEITMAEYEALVKAGTVDPLTQYNIVDAPAAATVDYVDQQVGDIAAALDKINGETI